MRKLELLSSKKFPFRKFFSGTCTLCRCGICTIQREKKSTKRENVLSKHPVFSKHNMICKFESTQWCFVVQEIHFAYRSDRHLPALTQVRSGQVCKFYVLSALGQISVSPATKKVITESVHKVAVAVDRVNVIWVSGIRALFTKLTARSKNQIAQPWCFVDFSGDIVAQLSTWSRGKKNLDSRLA